MLIVVDTCILHSDKKLQGRVFEILRAAYLAVDAIVIIPEVVAEELRFQYKKDVQKAIADYADAHKQLLKLGAQNFTSNSDKELETIERSLTEGFQSFFKDRLRLIGGRIMNNPDASHTQVAQRATTRRKPFAQSGKGYPDTLIWLSVVQLLQKHPDKDLILLTANTTDFEAKDRGLLHDDLFSDLDDLGIARSRIAIVRSITEFYQKHIEQAETQLGDARNRFNSNEQWIESVAERIADTIGDRNHHYKLSHLSRSHAEEVVSLDETEVIAVEAEDAWRENHHVVLGGIAEIGGIASIEVGETDWDGNPYTDTTSARYSSSVSFLVRLDEAAEELIEIEIGDFDPIYIKTTRISVT